MTLTEQTIFALSSGRPPAALAIVRISGSRAAAAIGIMAGRLPEPRVATVATLRDATGQPIDQAVVLFFRGPHSATGEDVAELHLHGGRAVLAAAMATLGAMDGLRFAEPGEFTRRAFENGKLDLTAAEGVDDLIHADTERQRRQALRQLRGLLGNKAENWRKQIIEASALVEAGIDFSDEGDVSAELIAPARQKVATLKAEISETIAGSARSERLRDGLVVAIAGPPNAGKSTLLNRIAQREAAIVSPHAGTTRDVIEVHLDLDGYPITLLDTAGVRDTADPVEAEGVRRARARADSADLVLWVEDAGNQAPHSAHASNPVWLVRNKIDLNQRSAQRAGPGDGFLISAAHGDGVPELVTALVGFAQEMFGTSEAGLVSRSRHRVRLEETVDALDRALAVKDGRDEILAEELRVAASALGRLTGKVDVEDILDVIFRDFCIGK